MYTSAFLTSFPYFTRLGMRNFWIGLNDINHEGRFVWASGSTSRYRNWNGKEPNNLGNEDCVQILTNSKWNDNKCGNGYPYVCEIDTIRDRVAYGDAKYVFVKQALNNGQAESNCNNLGGSLASIANDRENRFVLGEATRYVLFFIMFTDA